MHLFGTYWLDAHSQPGASCPYSSSSCSHSRHRGRDGWWINKWMNEEWMKESEQLDWPHESGLLRAGVSISCCLQHVVCSSTSRCQMYIVWQEEVGCVKFMPVVMTGGLVSALGLEMDYCWKGFSNSLIEIEFTYHVIHLFKAYNLVGSSVFMEYTIISTV